MEAALQFRRERLVVRVAEVFRSAVGIDVEVLREGAKRLGERAAETRERRGDARGSGIGAVEGAGSVAEVFGVEIVHLKQVGVEIGAGGADVAEGEDEVGCELLLDLGAPVVDGCGPTHVGRLILGVQLTAESLAVGLGRVEVGRRCERGKGLI